MTARMVRTQQGNRLEFKGDNGLAPGALAEAGHVAVVNTDTGQIEPASSETGLVPIGFFAGPEAVDNRFDADGVTPNTTTTKAVTVRLFREHEWVWMANDTGTPVTADMLLQDCFIKDSATVTGDNTTTSVMGKVWAVDDAKGVMIEVP